MHGIGILPVIAAASIAWRVAALKIRRGRRRRALASVPL